NRFMLAKVVADDALSASHALGMSCGSGEARRGHNEHMDEKGRRDGLGGDLGMSEPAVTPAPEPETGPLMKAAIEAVRDMKETLDGSPDDHTAIPEASQRLGSLEALMLRLVEARARLASRDETRPLTAVPDAPRRSRARHRIEGEHPIMRRVQSVAILAAL